MAKANWTVAAWYFDNYAWIMCAGSGLPTSEEGARGALDFCINTVASLGGVAELRCGGKLIAEYRTDEYKPGGDKHARIEQVEAAEKAA